MTYNRLCVAMNVRFSVVTRLTRDLAQPVARLLWVNHCVSVALPSTCKVRCRCSKTVLIVVSSV